MLLWGWGGQHRLGVCFLMLLEGQGEGKGKQHMARAQTKSKARAHEKARDLGKAHAGDIWVGSCAHGARKKSGV